MSGKKKHEVVASPIAFEGLTRAVYDTPFDRWLYRMGIKPSAAARESDVARSHVVRIRTGRMEGKASTIRKLVRGCQRLTTEPVRASEMFDLGELPDLPPPEGMRGPFPTQDDPQWSTIVLYAFRHAVRLRTFAAVAPCVDFIEIFWDTLAPDAQRTILKELRDLPREALPIWRRFYERHTPAASPPDDTDAR